MKKIASLFLIISLFLAACSSQKSSHPLDKHNPKKESSTTTLTKRDIKTDTTQTSKDTTQVISGTPPTENTTPLRTDGKWMQAGRLYFLQGTVTHFQRRTDGNSTVSILAEKTIIGAGGYDAYKFGTIHSFRLFKNPKSNILHHKVLLLVGQMTINDRDIFEGAVFFYVWRNGQFVDEQGKKAVFPLTDKDWHYLEEHQGGSVSIYK